MHSMIYQTASVNFISKPNKHCALHYVEASSRCRPPVGCQVTQNCTHLSAPCPAANVMV